MSDTVLIATPDLLGPLSTHKDLAAALAFPDSDAVAALDAIVQRRPRLVALERVFAASARGSALIDRIRMDPALTTCEIRIVAHDAAADAPASLSVSPPPPPAGPGHGAAPLDAHGTRTAPRFAMPAGFAIAMDGRTAHLVDLSLGGAQVVTPLALKPGQRVRLALPAAPRPLRVSAAVQWAKFEMPKEGARYRAGVRFLEANDEAIAQFIDAHKP